jgi:hypothetical protein
VGTKSPDSLPLSCVWIPPSTSDPAVNCRITAWAGVLDVSLYGLFGSSSSVTEETSELARYIDGCWVCTMGSGVVKDVTDETEPARELKKLPIFLVNAGGCGDGIGETADEDVGGDSGVVGGTEGLVAGVAPFQSLKLHLEELLGSSALAGVVGGGMFGSEDSASPTRNSDI